MPTGRQLSLLTDLQMQVAAIVGIVGGGVFLFGIIYKIYKAASRLESAIGIDEKGRTMSERMERVEYQLWENGGESLADRVNEIDKHARETAVEVRFIKEILIQNLGNLTAETSRKSRRGKKSVA